LIPNHIVDFDKLVEIVKDARDNFGIEGVTLSGGEPSLQKGLVDFNKAIHDLGLGIIMFSGKHKDALNPKLVNSVDLLIDGPFIESELDTDRVLLGSKNKNLTFITDRYESEADYFNNPVSIEEITAEDYIFINGD
jgi:anaerobic ribonucleoside-triphosphate reductase activating protein